MWIGIRVSPHPGMVFSHRKDWSIGACCPMGKSGQHYADGTERDTRVARWMIPCMYKARSKQIHGNRTLIRGSQGLGSG